MVCNLHLRGREMYRGTLVSMARTIMPARTLPGSTLPASSYLLHTIGVQCLAFEWCVPLICYISGISKICKYPRHFWISGAPGSAQEYWRTFASFVDAARHSTVTFWLTVSDAFIVGLSGPSKKVLGLRVDSAVRLSTAWSVIGDLNSPCCRPHQDIV
jgi:hypothetical protein